MKYARYKRYISIVLLIYLILTSVAGTEVAGAKEAKVAGSITDAEPSWYAVVKIDGSKKKLYIKGDIFYTRHDIENCFRIENIQKDTLILKNTDSKDVVMVKQGEEIPIKGSKMVFEKAIRRDVIDYSYKPGQIEKALLQDFK